MKAIDWIRNKCSSKTVFYVLGTLLTIILLSVIFVTKGSVFSRILHSKSTGSFTDLSDMMGIGKDVYSKGQAYPPLACLIFIFLKNCTYAGYCGLDNRVLFKTKQLSLMILIAMIILFTAMIICVVRRLLKTGDKEKILTTVLVFFSIPVMFEFERMNIVCIAWFFLFLFLALKDSKKKVLREIALISLAVAAGIKIYPAVFGLLLLFEKRYKETVRLVIYGLLAYLLPFLVFGGFGMLIPNIKGFLRGLFGNSNELGLNFSDRMLSDHGNYIISYVTIGNAIMIKIPFIIVMMLCLIIGAFGLRDEKKRILVLTCAMIGIPSVSFTYVLMFMIIPLMYFINDAVKERKNVLSYIYVFLITMILFTLPINFFKQYSGGIKNHYWNNISATTAQQMIAFTLLHITMVVEAAVVFVKNRKNGEKLQISTIKAAEE